MKLYQLIGRLSAFAINKRLTSINLKLARWSYSQPSPGGISPLAYRAPVIIGDHLPTLSADPTDCFATGQCRRPRPVETGADADFHS
jgi:hypothetical protein